MSTLAEALCSSEHPNFMAAFEEPCSGCEKTAAVVAVWLGSDEAVEVVAREAWVTGSSAEREWAIAAWEDMGGSEPSWERAAAEIAAKAGLAALAEHAKGEA